MHDVFIVSRRRGKTADLVRQVETYILAFVFINVHGNLLDEVNGLAIGWLESLEIDPENVVGIAGWQPLFEFAVVVGIDFPARLIGLIFAAPDLNSDSIDWSVVRSPHGPNDHRVGLSSGILSC
jgi:hypothetical protein